MTKMLLYLPAVCMLPAFVVAYWSLMFWLDCRENFGDGPPCGDAPPSAMALIEDPFVWLSVATVAYVAIVAFGTRRRA